MDLTKIKKIWKEIKAYWSEILFGIVMAVVILLPVILVLYLATFWGYWIMLVVGLWIILIFWFLVVDKKRKAKSK